MKTNREQTIGMKRQYTKPEIKSIKIDNQISMVMMSEPPTGPNESINMQNSQIVNPYKISNA